MLYYKTPNVGLNPILQSYHLLCGNTCRRRSDHIIDLQILACELHKMSLRPGSAPTRWGSYSAPQTR